MYSLDLETNILFRHLPYFQYTPTFLFLDTISSFTLMFLSLLDWTGQVILCRLQINLFITRNTGPPVPAGFLLQQNALDYFPIIVWEMWLASVIPEMPMGVKFFSLTETAQVFDKLIIDPWIVHIDCKSSFLFKTLPPRKSNSCEARHCCSPGYRLLVPYCWPGQECILFLQRWGHPGSRTSARLQTQCKFKTEN